MLAGKRSSSSRTAGPPVRRIAGLGASASSATRSRLFEVTDA
jgi:hypothetical protein